MKMLLAFIVCVSLCFDARANEWIPYRTFQPQISAPIQQQAPLQYPVPLTTIVVPLYIPYVPVVTYDSIIVEHKQWCLFKRYEIINVPKVQYVPIKY